MDQFIDIAGASGASYRFRAAPQPSALPMAAGNFVFVRHEEHRPQVVCCGSTNSLVQAGSLWSAAVEEHQAEGIYIHLNIARRFRAQVHEDISAKHQPAMAAPDMDP